MSCILSVGNPYSSFVEMLFANMLITKLEKSQNIIEFWRYNQDKPIILKLGHTNMAYHISKLLGLLYHPNKKTLSDITIMNTLQEQADNLNIYEKIWLGQL